MSKKKLAKILAHWSARPKIFWPIAGQKKFGPWPARPKVFGPLSTMELIYRLTEPIYRLAEPIYRLTDKLYIG